MYERVQQMLFYWYDNEFCVTFNTENGFFLYTLNEQIQLK